MRNSWSTPTDPVTVAKRAGGRAKVNSLRKMRARLRQGEVLRLLAVYGWGPGVQSRIARELGVHRSTVHRALRQALPAWRTCPRCHMPYPVD